jgi:hypothetical protein
MLIQAIQADPTLLESLGADPNFIIREVDKFQRIAELRKLTPSSKAQLVTHSYLT